MASPFLLPVRDHDGNIIFEQSRNREPVVSTTRDALIGSQETTSCTLVVSIFSWNQSGPLVRELSECGAQTGNDSARLVDPVCSGACCEPSVPKRTTQEQDQVNSFTSSASAASTQLGVFSCDDPSQRPVWGAIIFCHT